MAVARGQLTQHARFFTKGRALESVTISGTGTWQRVSGHYPVSITVGGSCTSFTYRVLVSNSQDKPTDNNTSQYGTDQSWTAGSPRQFFTITIPFEWVNIVPVAVAGVNFFADVWAG